MKLLHLPRQSNFPILKVLGSEYMKPKYASYVEHLKGYLRYMPVENRITNNLVVTVNVVLLDNLTRWVLNSDPMTLVEGMSYGTLPDMLDIGYRHYTTLLGDDVADSIDSIHTQKLVTATIGRYIADIYHDNKMEMDAALLELFETLYANIGHMEIQSHRAMILGNGCPALLISEKEYADCIAD